MSLVLGLLHLNRLKKPLKPRDNESFFPVFVLDMWLIKTSSLWTFNDFVKDPHKCTRFIGLPILGILSILGRYRPDKLICVVLLRRGQFINCDDYIHKVISKNAREMHQEVRDPALETSLCLKRKGHKSVVR